MPFSQDFFHDKRFFIDKVREAINSGCGMNPLVGSGASAASGIIMGLEFSDYLAYVVQRTTQIKDAWNLRKNGWPDYPTTAEYTDVRKWALSEFKQFVKPETGYEVGDNGVRITRIKPITDSLSDHLNCPDPPANIRASEFVPFDPSISHLNAKLKGRNRKADRYEPLWLTPEQSPSSSNWIRENAVRSLADWRATLRFLSRLKKERSGRVTLSRSNSSVIDRFNTFITADRQPSLAHKMLAALARPLRMRTVLTTNFDTLLEEAFWQSGHNLKKFFVSRRGRLPDPFLVRAQPSIIKVHGELLETRADFSLDDDPAIFDKRRFFRYFVDTRSGTEVFQSMLSHILVIGYSGNDLRTIRMLQYLLDETAHFQPDNQPRIFWICVSEGDVWRVNTYFKRYPQHRIVACRTDRPDLLLLELYQKVARAIPVAGQTYEYNHNVPPSPPGEGLNGAINWSESQAVHIVGQEAYNRLDPSDHRSVQHARDGLANVTGVMLYSRLHDLPETFDVAHPLYELVKIRSLSQLKEELVAHSAIKSNKYSALSNACDFWGHVLNGMTTTGRVLFLDSACGAIEALSVLHSRLGTSGGKRCLWFELSDYINGDALLRDVLRSVALRTGRFQREHVILHPLIESLENMHASPENRKAAADKITIHLKELCRIHNLTPADWTIIIYGRDLAGSCVNWQSTGWDLATWDQLYILIGSLAMAGFPVLIAHSSRERNEGEKEKWQDSFVCAEDNAQNFDRPTPDVVKYLSIAERQDEVALPQLFKQSAARDARLSIFSHMRNNVLKRCLDDVNLRKFIYNICLFRQSRRPSALFYEAVQPCRRRFNQNGIDNDVRRAEVAENVIRFLESERVFYLKAGGSSWMHRDIRVALRMTLDHIPWLEKNKKSKKGVQRWQSDSVGRVQFLVGDWYEKAFLSTGFAKPIFEALHHYYQAARLSPFAVPKGLKRTESPALTFHRFLLMRAALNAMTKLLLIGRPYLKLWMANVHGFPMFEIPKSAKGGSDYMNLVEWLWPESEDKRPEIHFSEDQEKELGDCYKLFWQISRDTQLAIQNEANIQISSDIAFMPVGLVTIGDDVQTKLKSINDSVYCSADDWRTSATSLINALTLEFGWRSKSNLEACQVCLPIGDGHAYVEEHVHAERKAQLMQSVGANLRRIPALLSIIEAVAYAQMRRAKFCGHTLKYKQRDEAWRHEYVRDEWLKVTRICNLGVDWCKHLFPSALKSDYELRIRFHSYYAVALANLDRFYEAHRHLTEALAIQSKHLWATPRIELAKLSLRRAEVILTEAHRVGFVLRLFANNGLILRRPGKKGITNARMIAVLQKHGLYERINEPREANVDHCIDVELHQAVRECVLVGSNKPSIVLGKLRRLLAAMLDDAWVSIENAEKSLSGQSQSSLWWGRVALMKLRACGYQLDLWVKSPETAKSGEEVAQPLRLATPSLKMLAYRHRRINPQCVWRLFETARLSGTCSVSNSKYRELRLVRYVAKCLQVFIHCKDELKFSREKSEELRRLSEEVKADSGCSAELVTLSEDSLMSVRDACDLFG